MTGVAAAAAAVVAAVALLLSSPTPVAAHSSITHHPPPSWATDCRIVTAAGTVVKPCRTAADESLFVSRPAMVPSTLEGGRTPPPLAPAMFKGGAVEAGLVTRPPTPAPTPASSRTPGAPPTPSPMSAPPPTPSRMSASPPTPTPPRWGSRPAATTVTEWVVVDADTGARLQTIMATPALPSAPQQLNVEKATTAGRRVTLTVGVGSPRRVALVTFVATWGDSHRWQSVAVGAPFGLGGHPPGSVNPLSAGKKEWKEGGEGSEGGWLDERSDPLLVPWDFPVGVPITVLATAVGMDQSTASARLVVLLE